MTTGPRAATKGAKVMLPDQPIAGRLHCDKIQALTDAPGVLTLVGAARERLANAIRVVPGAGRVARVEALVDELRVPDRDIAREAGIERTGQLPDWEGLLELEIHDLAKRMHARVRAARRR